MTRKLLTRRTALTGMAGAGTGLLLSGCDRIMQIPGALSMLESAEFLSQKSQRILMRQDRTLAREYQRSEISKNFKANGTTRPQSAEYAQLATNVR